MKFSSRTQLLGPSPEHPPDATREFVQKRDNGRCVVCNQPGGEVHHIIRRREALCFLDGQVHVSWNLATTCKAHNARAEEGDFYTPDVFLRCRASPGTDGSDSFAHRWSAARKNGQRLIENECIIRAGTSSHLFSHGYISTSPAAEGSESYLTYRQDRNHSLRLQELFTALRQGTCSELERVQLVHAGLKGNPDWILKNPDLAAALLKGRGILSRDAFDQILYRIAYTAMMVEAEAPGRAIDHLPPEVRDRIEAEGFDLATLRSASNPRSRNEALFQSQCIVEAVQNRRLLERARCSGLLDSDPIRSLAGLAGGCTTEEYKQLKVFLPHYGMSRIKVNDFNGAILAGRAGLCCLDTVGHPTNQSMYHVIGLAYLQMCEENESVEDLVRALWALDAACFLAWYLGVGHYEGVGPIVADYLDALARVEDINLIMPIRRFVDRNYDSLFRFRMNAGSRELILRGNAGHRAAKFSYRALKDAAVELQHRKSAEWPPIEQQSHLELLPCSVT